MNIRTLFVPILLLGLLLSSAPADTIYVSDSGNDGRSRQQATNRNTPWQSIQKGLNNAFAGDTVVLLDGHFYEHVFFPRSGNAGAPITLKTENRYGATLNGSVRGSNVNYITVDGLDILNWQNNGPITKGIFFNRCHHLVIRANRIHECRGGGISCDRCDSLLIEWNSTYRNAFWDIAQHSGISVYQPQYRGPNTSYWGIIIRNNYSSFNENKLNNPDFGRPTDGNGIVVDDFKNSQAGGNGQLYDRPTLITNNLCFNNGGQGIHCYRANNVFVRNNTCFNNMKSFEFGGEVSVSESSKIYVYNNILHARNGKNVSLQFDSQQVWWDYNVLFNGPVFGASNGGNTIYENPQFSSGGFTLSPSSPARDRGLTHGGLFPYDAQGRSRITNGRIDLGAYEYQN
jgi:parallel beta-helix repeat protein